MVHHHRRSLKILLSQVRCLGVLREALLQLDSTVWTPVKAAQLLPVLVPPCYLAAGGQTHKPHPADAAAAAALSKQGSGGSVSLPSSPVAKSKPASISRQGSQQLGQTTARRQSSLAPSLFSPVRQPSAASTLAPVRQPSSTLTPYRQASNANAAALLATGKLDVSVPSPPLAAAFTRAAQRVNSSNGSGTATQPPEAPAPDAPTSEPGHMLPGSVSTSVPAAVTTPVADDQWQVAEDLEASTQAGQSINAVASGIPEPFAQSADAASAPHFSAVMPLSVSAAEQPVLPSTAGDTLQPAATPVLNLHNRAFEPITAEVGADNVATHGPAQRQAALSAVAADYAKMMGEQEEDKQAVAAAEAGVTDLQPETAPEEDLRQLDSLEAESGNGVVSDVVDSASLIPAVLAPAPSQPSNRRAGSALFHMLAGKCNIQATLWTSALIGAEMW